MLYTDVIAGFLISGFVIVFVPQWVWNTLFCRATASFVSAENAVMGVAIAVISFVGSMGNVPFAVALWGGGVSFAGVIAFCLCRPHYSPRAQRLPEVLRLECDAVYPRRVLRDDGIYGVSHGTAI